EERRSAIEKSFSRAEKTPEAFKEDVAAVDAMEEALRTQLAMSPDEAKRELLDRGPGIDPLQNGIRGAVGGLIAALVLETIYASFGQSLSAVEPFLRLNHSIIPLGEGSDLLGLIVGVINAAALLVVAGFLFGYSYHIIRGDDGFVKGLLFA